jgi:metallophosphoesterase superfamily enzyme
MTEKHILVIGDLQMRFGPKKEFEADQLRKIQKLKKMRVVDGQHDFWIL